jgi:hypothetical protein
MADPHHEYHHGDMEISEQEATYSLFMNIAKWGSLYVAVVLIFLTIWFCTPLGWFTGLIAAAVVGALGWAALRSKPGAH